MKKKGITRYSLNEIASLRGETDWKRFDALADEDIDTSDIPEIPKEFWENVRVVAPKRQKKMVTLRMDEDVLAWFRRQGAGYQSRINSALREFMRQKDKPEKRT